MFGGCEGLAPGQFQEQHKVQQLQNGIRLVGEVTPYSFDSLNN